MTVFVFLDDANSENHYQFSNLFFAGILGFAEDLRASSELLRLLKEGSLMHGVWIEDYSLETQREFLKVIEEFSENLKRKGVEENYVIYVNGFVRVLAEKMRNPKTNFTYLNEEERFQL
ncbi:hypothetical protein [Deinococcus fonticola]|uniref:hypothetical protein n=1 Tax=Deinococcus fonticola TaxID=2528713 RepID=UPI001074B037|nr:hypothetical protein [Deinococcus fonticola]